MKTPTFTYEGGRTILRDGVPFIYIQPCVDPATGQSRAPFVDVDAFARTIPAAFDAVAQSITEEGAHCLQHTEAPGAMVRRLAAITERARAALALLDWRRN